MDEQRAEDMGNSPGEYYWYYWDQQMGDTSQHSLVDGMAEQLAEDMGNSPGEYNWYHWDEHVVATVPREPPRKRQRLAD